MTQTKKGFTLVELMVVIAIISLLSSIIFSTVSVARSKGRDAKRIREVKQLQTALELYYDQYGQYPASNQCGGTLPNNSWANSVECLSGNRWVRDTNTNLSAYIPSDPIDPDNSLVGSGSFYLSSAYFYYAQGYGAPQQWYMIVFNLENPNPSLEATDGVTAPNGTYFDYGAINGSDGVLTVGKGIR